MTSERYALGIDVGSTATAAATYRNGRVEVVSLSDHSAAMPSMVYVRDDGEVLVGDAARRRGATDPVRLASEFKRYVGSDNPVRLGSVPVRIEDLFAALIREVLAVVTAREGGEPAHITLTCPAEWGDGRRARLRDAGLRAGIAEVGLLTEPVAAATHYASLERRRVPPGTTFAVYDLGGATFDVALVRKTVDGFELRGRPTGCDLGGLDIDQIVLDHVRHAVGKEWPTDIDDTAVLTALTALRSEVVDRKEALSTDVDVTIPVLLPTINRQVRLTRGEFEEAIEALVGQTVDMVSGTFAEAGLDPDQVDGLLLVGGSSRIPLVTQRLKEAFPHLPLFVDEHPKWAISLGAAMAAASRLGHPAVSHPVEDAVGRQPSPAPTSTTLAPVVRPSTPPPTRTDALPAYAVDLTERALAGVRDDVALRPAADLRHRPAPTLTSQVAAELGPASPRHGMGLRNAVGIAVVAVLVVAVITLIILAAQR